jgi:hypothetical protein
LGVPVLSLFKQELCLLFRKRWIRRCFCALAIFVVACSVLIWWLLWHSWIVTHSCTDANSRKYLSDLVNIPIPKILYRSNEESIIPGQWV